MLSTLTLKRSEARDILLILQYICDTDRTPDRRVKVTDDLRRVTQQLKSVLAPKASVLRAGHSWKLGREGYHQIRFFGGPRPGLPVITRWYVSLTMEEADWKAVFAAVDYARYRGLSYFSYSGVQAHELRELRAAARRLEDSGIGWVRNLLVSNEGLCNYIHVHVRSLYTHDDPVRDNMSIMHVRLTQPIEAIVAVKDPKHDTFFVVMEAQYLKAFGSPAQQFTALFG